ncbi:MAG: hypothetical protein LHW45_08190 [Candidatus Cloacimonetes bacterium]|nr:hypothetical protein [Candidatus Cloacimonadota bacterium]MDY0367588.1 hypothetical protein [Candidatus Syntrophosphaera sp.]
MKTCKTRIGFRQAIDARLIISDLDGSHPREIRFDSFTNNFIRHFRNGFVKGASGENLVNSSDSVVGVFPAQSLTTGYLNGGIILGTGAPSRASTMYALATPLTADDVEFTPLFVDLVEDTNDNTSQIIFAKHFTNISGGNLAITEIGLTFSEGATYYLFSHDKIDYTFPEDATKKFSLVISLSSVWPRNFTRMLASTFSAYIPTIKTFDNADWTSTGPYDSNNYYRWNYNISYTKTGLQVGTGDAAEDITFYDLGTRLTTASLEFAETVFGAAIYDDNDPRFTMSRLIKNTTAEAVVINEIGIGGRAVGRYSGAPEILIFRKKLLIPVTIEAGEWASFEITFHTTFE